MLRILILGIVKSFGAHLHSGHFIDVNHYLSRITIYDIAVLAHGNEACNSSSQSNGLSMYMTTRIDSRSIHARQGFRTDIINMFSAKYMNACSFAEFFLSPRFPVSISMMLEWTDALSTC